MPVWVLPRESWDLSGLPRLGWVVPAEQFRGLVVHHTVSYWDETAWDPNSMSDEAAHMRTLQLVRPDLGADVPYSWVIFEQPVPHIAVVAEGRGYCRTGAHTAGFNSSRYGVALAGNYSDRPVTPGMIDAINWVGAQYCAHASEPTVPHSDSYATACPGNMMRNLMPTVQPPFTFHQPSEDDDMTKEELAAAMGCVIPPQGHPRAGLICVPLLESVTRDANGNIISQHENLYPWGEASTYIHKELKLARLTKPGNTELS